MLQSLVVFPVMMPWNNILGIWIFFYHSFHAKSNSSPYFSKKAFVNPLLKNEFTFIGRLRKDADLLYFNKKKSAGKRGRPKKYAGKVDPKNINEGYLESVPSTDLETQARSENKLNFHFNTALTVLNLAKATHWLKIPKEDRRSFSMNDVKTINHNTLLINRFLVKFGIDPNLAKNQSNINDLIYYGTIAA